MTVPTPSGLMHLRTWLDRDVDVARFSQWCDGHQVEQLVVPGIRRVRRFSLWRSAGEAAPDSLTMYDLDHLDVLASDAFAELRRRSTGLPEFLAGRLRAVRCDAWLVEGVPAVAGLTGGGEALAHLFVDEGDDLADWFAEAGLPLLDAAGATTGRLLRSAQGEQVVLVEIDRADPDLDPASLPVPPTSAAGDGATPGWGIYRLDFLATPEGESHSPHLDREG